MAHTQLKSGSQENRDVVNELAEALDVLEGLAVTDTVGDGTITTAKLATATKATVAGAPTFAIGSETSHARTVTATLKDIAGTALAAKAKATVWISSTAGGVPAATPPSSTTTFGTGTVLKILTADVLFEVVSDATGVIAVTITEATAKSFYVNIAIGNQVASSAAVTFAG